MNLKSLDDLEPLLSDYPGSQQYAAPEIVMRQKYKGTKADIWALGVVYLLAATLIAAHHLA